MKKIIVASSLRLSLLACLVVLLPNHTEAAVGDNCAVNIANSLPTDVDWRNAYIIKGEDGSAWQRAIINNPRDVLTIEEGKASKITGTAGVGSEVQVFLFAPSEDANGMLQKPTDANCYDAGVTNEQNYFEFPVQAVFIWPRIGQELAIDAFYRMEKSWDQINSETTNKNFFIGTHMPMKTATVVPISKDTGDDDDDDDDDDNHADDDDDDNDDNGNNNGSICDDPSGLLPGFTDYIYLDPDSYRADLRANNFDGVEEQPVIIAHATHTFYGAVDGTQGGFHEKIVATGNLSIKAIVLELTKRIMLAHAGMKSTPGIDSISQQSLQEIYDGSMNVSPKVSEVVTSVHDLLLGSETERNQGAKSLAKSVSSVIIISGLLTHPAPYDPETYLELFPANVSSESSWASDFIDMLEFWTGTKQANGSIIFDFTEINFLHNPQVVGANYPCQEYDMYYLHGHTPRILIRPDIDLKLEPDFRNIFLTYSDRLFENDSSWQLPAKVDTEIYYEYANPVPLKAKAIAEYCLNHSDVPHLAETIGASLALRTEEKELLKKELQSQLPKNNDLYQISLVDPADISRHFAWKGNGESLDIQQLFFHYQARECDQQSFADEIPLPPNPEREGFETGFIFDEGLN